MTWDSVPWAVGGGAVISAEAFRLVAYVAFRGNEGILSPSDLAVTALSTPGASVNVAPGACSILCRASGETYQAYAGRLPVQDTVSIAATGASARSDMIVARIEDPWLAGEPWADPTDPTVGPYVFTRVISGVASTATTVTELGLGYSAIPLARIDIPASTGTITQSMITDLRQVANPRRDAELITYNPPVVASVTASSFTDWIASWPMAIPSWAVRVFVSASIGGVRLDRSSTTVNGNSTGQIRAMLGTAATQGAAYDLDVVPTAVTSRFTLGVADRINIPSAMRGTTQTLKLQALQSAGNKPIYVDTGSFLSISLEFQEAAA